MVAADVATGDDFGTNVVIVVYLVNVVVVVTVLVVVDVVTGFEVVVELVVQGRTAVVTVEHQPFPQ